MKVAVNRDVFLKALEHTQGVIEKKNTLQILSNVLIEAKDKRMRLTSTDLDLIFIEELSNLEILEEGSTTTSASILYDIIRKFPNSSKINLSLIEGNKLELKSGNSNFKLLCLSPNDFPLIKDDTEANIIEIDSTKLLKILNKTKFSISSDETRHYLSGIFLHKTQFNGKSFLSAVSTDSHRLSLSRTELGSNINFEPVILPKKTIFQLSSLLEGYNDQIKISNNKSKIKFNLKNSVLISKVIDGKFPNYNQVIPNNNQKILEINLKNFINSVDHVVSVSSDRKEGVKMNIVEDSISLSVNNPNSGDGTAVVKSVFNSDKMSISFNSKYIMDIASQIEGEKIIFKLNDAGSPAIVSDLSDSDSLYVLMPMKI